MKKGSAPVLVLTAVVLIATAICALYVFNRIVNKYPPAPNTHIQKSRAEIPQSASSSAVDRDKRNIFSPSQESTWRAPATKNDAGLSALEITAIAPVSILVTDFAGRRAGADPYSETVYKEIADSSYALESLTKNVQTLRIQGPVSGAYSVRLYSTKAKIEAEFSVYDKEGNISVSQVKQTLFPNKPLDFELNYSPKVGSKINLLAK